MSRIGKYQFSDSCELHVVNATGDSCPASDDPEVGLEVECVLHCDDPEDGVYGTDITATIEGTDMELSGEAVELLGLSNRAGEIFMDSGHVHPKAGEKFMDRDDVKPGGKLNTTKERILEELGEEQCWVTKGREIENYLRPELIDRYLTAKCGQQVNIKFTSNSKLQNAITAATKDLDVSRVNHTKVEYARAFCELMDAPDLDVRDLLEKLNQLVQLIRKWNHLDAE